MLKDFQNVQIQRKKSEEIILEVDKANLYILQADLVKDQKYIEQLVKFIQLSLSKYFIEYD